jgi:hypothetical protein
MNEWQYTFHSHTCLDVRHMGNFSFTFTNIFRGLGIGLKIIESYNLQQLWLLPLANNFIQKYIWNSHFISSMCPLCCSQGNVMLILEKFTYHWNWNEYHSKSIFFYVHGSVHIGNLYIRLKVQQDGHGFVCILYFTIFALHVSGAIYTHHQEHKLQGTAVGTRDCYGVWEVG